MRNSWEPFILKFEYKFICNYGNLLWTVRQVDDRTVFIVEMHTFLLQNWPKLSLTKSQQSWLIAITSNYNGNFSKKNITSVESGYHK